MSTYRPQPVFEQFRMNPNPQAPRAKKRILVPVPVNDSADEYTSDEELAAQALPSCNSGTGSRSVNGNPASKHALGANGSQVHRSDTGTEVGGKSPMEVVNIIGASPKTNMTPGQIRLAKVDGVTKISIYDVMEYICDIQNRHHRSQLDKMISKMEEGTSKVRTNLGDFNEGATKVPTSMGDFISSHKFKGRGQQETPVTDSKGLLRIMLYLPGPRAAHIREHVLTIANRYYAGDRSLCTEVREIASHLDQLEQTNPDDPALMFRESSNREEQALPRHEKERLEKKRKREEEIEEIAHRLKMEDMRKEHEKKQISHLNEQMQMLENLFNPQDNTGFVKNETDVIWLADLRRNQSKKIFNTFPQITDDPHDPQDLVPGQPRIQNADQVVVTVAEVAQQMGVPYRGPVLASYGKTVAAAFREKYNRDPPSRRQELSNGRPMWVKQYYEKDRQMMVDAIQQFVGAQA